MCLYFKNESVNFPFSQYRIVFSISIFIFALDRKKKSWSMFNANSTDR